MSGPLPVGQPFLRSFNLMELEPGLSWPLIGIDPGLGSGGLVGIDAANNDKVLYAHSLVPPRKITLEAKREADEFLNSWGGWGDRQYLEAERRALWWLKEVKRALAEFSASFGEARAIAIESFVDQPSRAHKRLIRNGWQTPHVIGLMGAALRRLGYSPEAGNLVYQNAGVVLRQYNEEIAILSRRHRPYSDGLVAPGDSLIDNEHEIRALVHALALSHHLSQHRPTSTQPVESVPTQKGE